MTPKFSIVGTEALCRYGARAQIAVSGGAEPTPAATRSPAGVSLHPATWPPALMPQPKLPDPPRVPRSRMPAAGSHRNAHNPTGSLCASQTTSITGWLSRTDFADRKQFEQVLGYVYFLGAGRYL